MSSKHSLLLILGLVVLAPAVLADSAGPTDVLGKRKRPYHGTVLYQSSGFPISRPPPPLPTVILPPLPHNPRLPLFPPPPPPPPEFRGRIAPPPPPKLSAPRTTFSGPMPEILEKPFPGGHHHHPPARAPFPHHGDHHAHAPFPHHGHHHGAHPPMESGKGPHKPHMLHAPAPGHPY